MDFMVFRQMPIPQYPHDKYKKEAIPDIFLAVAIAFLDKAPDSISADALPYFFAGHHA